MKYEMWQAALLTLAILWYIAFIICGVFIGIYLSLENNKLGILVMSLALLIIGTIISLIIIEKKRKIVNKSKKEQ